MDDVKKKVLLDLFASPWTVVPWVGGLSAWMLSWGMNGNTALNLVGLAGVLAGVGIQASRLIFGLEKITEDAHSYLIAKERREREARLDELETKLRQDGDARTEECLKRLRKLYEVFDEEPATRLVAITIREKFEQLFHAAIRQLERSYELWAKAQRLPGRAGRPLLAQRKAAIDEVVLTLNHLTNTFEQYHAIQVKDDDRELAKLREELDATIEVARRAEDRMEAFDVPSRYEPSE